MCGGAIIVKTNGKDTMIVLKREARLVKSQQASAAYFAFIWKVLGQLRVL